MHLRDSHSQPTGERQVTTLPAESSKTVSRQAQAPRRSLGSRWQAFLLALLTVGLLFFFFRGTDFTELVRTVAGANLGLIAAAVAVTMLTYVVRALRWKYLLSAVGEPGWRNCFVTTVIGFMVNFIVPPGRLGELARPYLLARREGFSASSAFATVFLERVLDLITVILLVGFWLLAGSVPSGARSEEAIDGLKLGGLAAFLGAGTGLGLMYLFARHRGRSLELLDRLVVKLPARLARSSLRFFGAFADGLAVLEDRSNLTRAGALSLALWLNISLAFWLGARAFAIEFPFGATFLVVGFLTVGVALPTPGAVGGYHVMCALALTLLFGVDESGAKAAALVTHAIAFLPVSLLGLFFFTREGLTFREMRSFGHSA